MLESVEWGEYRLGDLFEIHPTKAYKYTNNELFSFSGDTPVVTNTSLNNGISGTVGLSPTEEGGIITYSDTTTSDAIFYQPRPFVGYSHVQGLYPKDYKWGQNTLLYAVASFRKSACGLFDYGNKFNRAIASEMNIILPTRNGRIDFEFMEKFIAELKALRIAELKAYLFVTGLKDYTLTTEEEQIIKDFEIGNVEWEEFDVTKVFEVCNAGNILANEIVEGSGSTPYLCASRENNAVSSYISYREELITEGNCIFIGGKTFVVTYQECDFFSNDSHNLTLRLYDSEHRTKLKQLYLTTCVTKSLGHKYSWGDSVSNRKIQKDKILLPCIHGQVDFSKMGTFISAIQKLVIKDVVLYADREIEATKQVINKTSSK